MLRFFKRKNTDTQTDEELLAAYLADKDARYLGKLFDRYIPMVYGVCLKILKDANAAEDAVMGIYEHLTKKVDSEHEIEQFRPWLYVVARNYCLMEWRKKQRNKEDLWSPEDMHRLDGTEDAFDLEIDVANKSALQKCLDALPDLQLKCVELFYLEDKSYKEITELLGSELGATRSYIQNGKRNLKLCLEAGK
jgi:RNA polymerase sigma-70 factor (ECF subfamily)